jgi:threonine dehydrogenase-like Zn-dependent dehydrogenase
MKSIIIDSKGKVKSFEEFIPQESQRFLIVKTKKAVISSGTETYIIKLFRRSFFQRIKEQLLSIEGRKAVKQFRKTNSIKSIILMTLRTIHPFFNKYFRKFSLYAKFNPPSKPYSGKLGYSSSGIIVSHPEKWSTKFKHNKRVACAGQTHAEYIKVPINLAALIPEDVNFSEAAFTTIGCIAMQSIRLAKIQLGDYVVISGVGLIGQICIQLAKLAGAIIIAVDLIPEKLKLASKMGADFVINASLENEIERIKEITNEHGADISIVAAATKLNTPLVNAMEYLREKGTVILLGNVPINFPRDPFYKKEIKFLISRSYGYGRYDPIYEQKGTDYPIKFVRWTENRQMELFLKLLQYKKINLEPLISRIVPIENVSIAYDQIINDPINNMAVILDFEELHEKNQLKNHENQISVVKINDIYRRSKNLLQNQKNPLIISYTIYSNSFLDNEMIFYRICYLMNSTPIKIFYRGENIIQIQFEDQSLANIIRSKRINQELGERVEIFAGGASISIINSKFLKLNGFYETFTPYKLEEQSMEIEKIVRSLIINLQKSKDMKIPVIINNLVG